MTHLTFSTEPMVQYDEVYDLGTVSHYSRQKDTFPSILITFIIRLCDDTDDVANCDIQEFEKNSVRQEAFFIAGLTSTALPSCYSRIRLPASKKRKHLLRFASASIFSASYRVLLSVSRSSFKTLLLSQKKRKRTTRRTYPETVPVALFVEQKRERTGCDRYRDGRVAFDTREDLAFAPVAVSGPTRGCVSDLESYTDTRSPVRTAAPKWLRAASWPLRSGGPTWLVGIVLVGEWRKGTILRRPFLWGE